LGQRTEEALRDVIPGIVFAVSLVQAGHGIALVGLVLGAGFSLFTRFGRPPRGPTGRGQEDVWRVTAKPLLAVGVIGLILWAIGSLRH